MLKIQGLGFLWLDVLISWKGIGFNRCSNDWYLKQNQQHTESECIVKVAPIEKGHRGYPFWSISSLLTLNDFSIILSAVFTFCRILHPFPLFSIHFHTMWLLVIHFSKVMSSMRYQLIWFESVSFIWYTAIARLSIEQQIWRFANTHTSDICVHFYTWHIDWYLIIGGFVNKNFYFPHNLRTPSNNKAWSAFLNYSKPNPSFFTSTSVVDAFLLGWKLPW